MIRKAREDFPGGAWLVGDLWKWSADEPNDLVFSNATLQWVPDHARLCRRLFDQVAPGGALAVQIPAPYRQPLYRELIAVSR
jgi:trans-aconitate 2-methyltransferase